MVEAPTPASTMPGGSEQAVAGSTTINTAVIATVAGIAANGVDGVYTVGGTASRALGALRDAVALPDRGHGVTVEVDERAVRVEISLVAEYPLSLQRVVGDVRAAVSAAITNIVGMDVAEVDVIVSDVHVPGDNDFLADQTGTTASLGREPLPS